MNKELSPLEALKLLSREVYNVHNVKKYFECLSIVEKALKRLEEIDNKKVVYVAKTPGKAQKVIDELSKHKEIVITNLSDQKKLKALTIIKEYNLITYQECFDAICTKGYVHDLPRNVVKLLKEVFEDEV